MTPQGEAKYRKLRRGIFLGSDHLLLCARNMFTESYRRLYFNEIQCVLLRRTGRRLAISLFWAPLLLIAVIWILADLGDGSFPPSAPGGFVLLALLCIPVAGITINILLGPTCRVHIRTPIATRWFAGRERKVRKIIELLCEQITKVQGPLQLEQIAATQAQATPSASAQNFASQSTFAGEVLRDMASAATNGEPAAPASQAAARGATVAPASGTAADNAAMAPGAAVAPAPVDAGASEARND
jgi:hypothetical protein